MSNAGLEKIDVVVLAGSHKSPKRLIQGENKAFLDFNGKPMIRRVVESFLNCPEINRIVVVGPREKLEDVFKDLRGKNSRLKIIPQRARMLENVWTGFLATFSDGNNLPMNREFETLLLGGHLPIKKKMHLEMFYSVYAAVAAQMEMEQRDTLPRASVVAAMERRFDQYRHRFERREWFMGKIGIDTILKSGHVLKETETGIHFSRETLYKFFLEWNRRYNAPIMVATSDIPFITPDAISDFIRRCSPMTEEFYYCVASSDVLDRFKTAEDGGPGIDRPYMPLREARVRASNIIIVKPNRVGNKELIQEGFGIRKMTKWRNVIAMIGKLLGQKNRYQTLRMAFMTQASAVCLRNGCPRIAEWIRSRTRGRQMENIFSHLFRTRFKLVVSPHGLLSLDADNEMDYTVMKENTDFFKKIQTEFLEETTGNDIQVFNAL